ncbi:hypothetical protein FXO38_14156 [Capsicum annuum]|nr:hypothetical protein FXO38_14156 [Capsicum annuum]
MTLALEIEFEGSSSLDVKYSTSKDDEQHFPQITKSKYAKAKAMKSIGLVLATIPIKSSQFKEGGQAPNSNRGQIEDEMSLFEEVEYAGNFESANPESSNRAIAISLPLREANPWR